MIDTVSYAEGKLTEARLLISRKSTAKYMTLITRSKRRLREARFGLAIQMPLVTEP